MWLDNLKAMKEQSGMTTKEISAKSGIPEPTLEKLFAGATKDPKLATMQQLVHFFGRTLDDLDDSSIGMKKSPSTAEAAPGEKDLELFDKLLDGLISTGRIVEGKDISASQAEVLSAICRILDATF